MATPRAASRLAPLGFRGSPGALTRSGETGPSEALFRVPHRFAPSLSRAGFFDALHHQSGALPLDPELDVGVGVAPSIGGQDLRQFQLAARPEGQRDAPLGSRPAARSLP
jgi:hypothetical protein